MSSCSFHYFLLCKNAVSRNAHWARAGAARVRGQSRFPPSPERARLERVQAELETAGCAEKRVRAGDALPAVRATLEHERSVVDAIALARATGHGAGAAWAEAEGNATSRLVFHIRFAF